MRIPMGRPMPVVEPGEHEHLSDRARALLWAATHRKGEQPPCRLAALYDKMRVRNPERFYKLFEKYSDQGNGERRKLSAVAPWRYR